MTAKDFRQIADNIKYYRKLRNLTQEQMAFELDIDAQYYAQLEQGRRNFTLEKLIDSCAILNVRIEDIIPTSDPSDIDTKPAIEEINKKLAGASIKQLSVINQFIDQILPLI